MDGLVGATPELLVRCERGLVTSRVLAGTIQRTGDDEHDLALEHELIVTGSSDYHGTGKPNVPGEYTTTDEMVGRIIARATGSAPVFP